MSRQRGATALLAVAGCLTLLLTSCASTRVGVVGLLPPAISGGDPVGQWGEIAERSPHITMLDDGTMFAHDGCNGMGGTWDIEDGVVEFGDVVTTLMACPDHDAWLRPATAAVRGDTLVVFDERGVAIGTLPRILDE